MLRRKFEQQIKKLLSTNAAVVLIGPRQIGKTTIATQIGEELGAIYRDLETPRDLTQVQDINLFAETYPDKLIILDEVQRTPEIFAPLRGIIDERRRKDFKYQQFLFLGSASLDLLGQTSESLAGRVAYAELAGINVSELDEANISESDLWLRGGFPDNLLAPDNETSLQRRKDLIRSYLERDVPQFGFRVPAETMRRLWTIAKSAVNSDAYLSATFTLPVSGETITKSSPRVRI